MWRAHPMWRCAGFDPGLILKDAFSNFIISFFLWQFREFKRNYSLLKLANCLTAASTLYLILTLILTSCLLLCNTLCIPQPCRSQRFHARGETVIGKLKLSRCLSDRCDTLLPRALTFTPLRHHFTLPVFGVSVSQPIKCTERIFPPASLLCSVQLTR